MLGVTVDLYIITSNVLVRDGGCSRMGGFFDLFRGQASAGNCGRPPGYRYPTPHSPTEILTARLNNEQKRVVVFSYKLCLKSV